MCRLLTFEGTAEVLKFSEWIRHGCWHVRLDSRSQDQWTVQADELNFFLNLLFSQNSN